MWWPTLGMAPASHEKQAVRFPVRRHEAVEVSIIPSRLLRLHSLEDSGPVHFSGEIGRS